jgi:Zn-dependent protease with chaperone function
MSLIPQSFQAIVYGPSLPVSGLPVIASFRAEQLLIEIPSGQPLCVDAAQIHVSVGGFDHKECFLNWHESDTEQWALKPQSLADIAIVLQTAPTFLQPQFKQWHYRRYHLNLVWGSLGAIAGVLALSLGLLWWQYDNVVTWAIDHVSTAKEQQLGDALLEQIKADGDIVEHGPAVEAVSKIGAQLTQGSHYKYQWLVKKDKTVNAFALPGGIIIVNSALLKKTDRATELAAVLAHEVQHVEQRHALKNMVHSLGWATALIVVLGDVNIATAVIVHQMGSMYFSRDIEDEADRLGYQALVKAKISPDGLVSFFQKLQQQHEADADVPEWISSHPATAERIKTMQKLIQEQPCGDCKPVSLDWKPVQEDIGLVIIKGGHAVLPAV